MSAQPEILPIGIGRLKRTRDGAVVVLVQCAACNGVHRIPAGQSATAAARAFGIHVAPCGNRIKILQ